MLFVLHGSGMYFGQKVAYDNKELKLTGLVSVSMDAENQIMLNAAPAGLGIFGPSIEQAATYLNTEFVISVTEVDIDDDHELCRAYKTFWQKGD